MNERYLKFALKYIFGLSLFYIALSKVEIELVILSLKHQTWHFYLAATAVSFLGIIWCQAKVIKINFSALNLEVTLTALTTLNAIMMFYSFFLPSVIAYLLRVKRYRAFGLNTWASLSAATFQKVLLILLSGITCGFSAAQIDTQDKSEVAQTLLDVAVIIGFISAISAITLLFILPLFHHNFKEHTKLHGLASSFSSFTALDLRKKGAMLLYTVLQHGSVILSAVLVMLALNITFEITSVALVRSLIVIIGLFPLTVAGLGVREIGFVTLLPPLGIPETEAFAAAVSLLTIQITLALVGAALESFRFLTGIYNDQRN